MHTGVPDKAGLEQLEPALSTSDEAVLNNDTCTMGTVRHNIAVPKTAAAITDKTPSRAGARGIQAVLLWT